MNESQGSPRSYIRDKTNNTFFNNTKREMHSAAVERGKKLGEVNEKGETWAVYNDMYTNNPLRGGRDNYEYDHVRSSGALYAKHSHEFNDAEMAELINVTENLGVTSMAINRSKGKYEMEKILENPDKVKHLSINVAITKQRLILADDAIQIKIEEIRARNKQGTIQPVQKEVETATILPISEGAISKSKNIFAGIPTAREHPKKTASIIAAAVLCLLFYNFNLFGADDNVIIKGGNKFAPKSASTPSISSINPVKKTLSNTLNFKIKDSQLSPSIILNLKMKVDSLNQLNDNYVLTIKGYTCDLGTETYNQELSKLRAENVEKFFVENGIDPEKIKTSWYGETLFEKSANIKESRNKSRKVIVQIE
jgi:outer membrane protein OmpA-like peptidoglycan-associated protein